MIFVLITIAVLVWIGLLEWKSPLIFFWTIPLALLSGLLMFLAGAIVIIASFNTKYAEFVVLDKN